MFLAALNIFFGGGDDEISRNFLSEFYQNMTVSALSIDNSFKFDAFTDLLTNLSVMFQGLGNRQVDQTRNDDDQTALKMKSKFEFDDFPPPPPYATIADSLNVEPKSIEQKIKQEDVVEPTLQPPTQIKQTDTERKFDKEWLDKFLNGVKTTIEVLQELNDQAIADILFEEVNVLEANTQIDPIFIDNYDIFSKDDLTDKNKEFTKTLLDKSNYFFDDEYDDEQQRLIQTDLSKPQMTGDTNTDENISVETPIYSIDTPVIKAEPPIEDPFINDITDHDDDVKHVPPPFTTPIDNVAADIDFEVTKQVPETDDEVIYVKYVSSPPDNPVKLIHPRDKFKQKVNRLRKRKEEYRKRAKKRAIQTLINKKKTRY